VIRTEYRKTPQPVLPAIKPPAKEGMYDIYPPFPVGPGIIHRGIESLAERIANEKTVILDGYQGIFFDDIRDQLDQCLGNLGKTIEWHDVRKYMKPEKEIDRMIEPFLGGNDPLFGKRTPHALIDFFNPLLLDQHRQNLSEKTKIIYGRGSAIVHSEGYLVYFDLPKNEFQYRSRAGTITNLGAANPLSPKEIYKRAYFVDWVVLNRHKEQIAKQVDILVDGQRPDDITWIAGNDFRATLQTMSRSAFRARPWFEPGAWGGTWCKEHIPGLSPDVPNYAWSFELITPENGIILGSDGLLLEFSFDWLMYLHAKEVLGNCHARFGNEFPIRFDFLDTFDGGNLSIQVHPREEYIREHFGESFTQQEAYYILDTKDNAIVNLGFQVDIDPEKFRTELERSARGKTPVDIPSFIRQHPAQKHDLFLIPDGTVHGSGRNNLVLEISTTPYIFTFKMYDWLRLDLDGNPRDLNIRRAFENLDFERKGEIISKEFISRPILLEEGADWKKYHLPTHPLHYYDVWRYHFKTSVTIETGNNCHVLSVAEGGPVSVKTDNGRELNISYAETFVVPAAAVRYTVVNRSGVEALLIIAFIR
jgi:mannose-6-phosphate isomerase class I